MGVILADSADAATFLSNLNQPTADSNSAFRLGKTGNTDTESIATRFTTGSHLRGFVLREVKVSISASISSGNALVSIYSANPGDNSLGNKLYDLNGSVTSPGTRTFSVPSGAVLARNTNYYVHIQAGSGSGVFEVEITHSTGVDSAQAGWSIGGSSDYILNNGNTFRIPGGLKIQLVGVDRSSNFRLTGKPSIEGTVQFGETLTVDTSGIGDHDGVIEESFSYQWVRVDAGAETNISGATSSAYTVGSDDVGKRLKVKVSFIDGHAYRESVVSDVSGVVRDNFGNAPSEGKPVINGSFQFGQTLTVDTSGISDEDGLPDSFSYQWVRVDGGSETDISGATSTTYPIVEDDLGGRLKVEVSFTDDAGFSEGPLVSDLGFVPIPVLVSNINSPTSSGGHTLSGGVFVAQGFTTGNHSNGYDVSRIMVKITEASTREPVVSIYSSNDKKLGTKLYDFNGSVNATGNRFFTASVDVILSPDTSYFVRISGRGGGSFKVARGRGSTNGPDSGSLSDWSLLPFVFLDSGNPNPESLLRFSVLGLPRSSPLPDVNHVPVFSGSANFSVNENNKTVGTVVASDSDSQDNVTGYRVSGGADSSRFSIADDGVLSFKSTPNYENPSDSGKNNEYVVEVTAGSGSSGRERFASRTFTVRVVNVVESPSAPDAPGLTSLNSTSLLVSWSAPSNTGPSIVDYDVGYGLNSGGPFADWPHSGAGRRAVITGLSAGTLYYVRVRAGNAEGNGSWSRTSAFVTDPADAVLPVNRSVLVSNINQRLGSGGWTIDGNNYVAQEFTTGNYSNGYTVSRIVVNIHTASSTRVPLVSIYSSEGGRPGVKLYEFNGSVTATGNRDFTVPAGVTLGSDTNYFVHIAGRGNGSFKVQRGYHLESAGGFDSGSFPGWSISSYKIVSGSSPSLTLLLRFSVWGAERSGPVPDVNQPPVFSSSSSFSVSENGVGVGTVVADDSDVDDGVTGYRVSGGVDASLFDLTSAGVLSFVSAPNYESPRDNGTDNVYALEVEVTSGTGSRVKTAVQTITVTVVDVDEAPSAPGSPVLSSPSSTSLLVSWSAPSNTGPSIIDYDVGYGLNSGGPFTDWPHSDASRSATLTGLNASTLYYVRVLARNAEGNSSWSETSSFTTGSAVTNSDPVFSSSSSFSVNENVRNVGTVVASDSDSPDSVTGYSISGGDDRARFSITGGGVLSFVSVPDFEVPVDVGGNNVYDLVVTVTSGTGSRVRTATQSISVTVVDVVEGGSNSDPVFSSSSSFSVNENIRVVGVVVASDPDSQDGVSGYSVSGGVDRARFSIMSGGVLSFVSVPDFEVPVDVGGNNVYDLVVTVTSGTGSRVRTATQTIIVTVVDVVEGGSNSDPVFSSSSSFSVNENVRNVGTVVASDSDSQDGVSGYSVSGGVDRARFSITNAGVLTFVSAPDFESPADSGGNNVYDLVVTVTSGTGGRVRTATQTIIVTVVDVDEGGSNSDPVFSSSSSFSVNENVRNVGTVVASDSDSQDGVSGYSVSGGVDRARFSITTGGVLTFRSAPDYEAPADSGGNNVYNIVVTATSGTSGRVRTATQSISVTVVDVVEGGSNSPPVFSSGSSFSVNENVRGVGVVVASDSDTQDSVTGYRVSGGADRARFSITTGGVLTFVSAPDYESPADSGGNNVYNLVVTATSGTGGRVRTATQSISVTVVDVGEGPVIPPKDVVLVYNCG